VQTIDWADREIRIIDQTPLPAEEFILSLSAAETDGNDRAGSGDLAGHYGVPVART
jgi:hypothetical protein